jgi:hypothetical protein
MTVSRVRISRCDEFQTETLPVCGLVKRLTKVDARDRGYQAREEGSANHHWVGTSFCENADYVLTTWTIGPSGRVRFKKDVSSFKKKNQKEWYSESPSKEGLL